MTALTQRETRVLQLVALGWTYKDIADELTIAYRTVTSHVHHIARKTGCHGAANLTWWALRAGLVKMGDRRKNAEGCE